MNSQPQSETLPEPKHANIGMYPFGSASFPMSFSAIGWTEWESLRAG